MLDGDHIYKIRSEVWVAPSPKNLAAQKHQNFVNFATWSQISPECNKISSVGKQLCKLQTLLHRQT